MAGPHTVVLRAWRSWMLWQSQLVGLVPRDKWCVSYWRLALRCSLGHR